MATPFLLRPFEHGADIVVHSLTKYLGGHGTSLGGAIIDSGRFDWTAQPQRFARLNQPDPSYHGVVYTEALGPAAYIGRARVVPLRNTGAALSPFNAFLILRGIETLALRMRNASTLLRWRRAVPEVTRKGGVGQAMPNWRRSRARRRAALSGWARLGRADLRPAGRARGRLTFP